MHVCLIECVSVVLSVSVIIRTQVHYEHWSKSFDEYQVHGAWENHLECASLLVGIGFSVNVTVTLCVCVDVSGSRQPITQVLSKKNSNAIDPSRVRPGNKVSTNTVPGDRVGGETVKGLLVQWRALKSQRIR